MLTSDARNGLRFAVIGAMIAGGLTQSAKASGISTTFHYHTLGTIDPTGLVGAPGVSFQGISDGTASTPANAFQPGTFSSSVPADYTSTLPLGQFVVTPPTGPGTTNYGALYHIKVTIDTIGGKTPDSGPITLSLDGSLGGAVSEHGASSLEARPVYISDGPPFSPDFGVTGFQTPGYVINLTAPQLRIPLNFDPTTGSSQTPISAVLVSNSNTAPNNTVPEPAAICPLLLAATGWLIRRRLEA